MAIVTAHRNENDGPEGDLAKTACAAVQGAGRMRRTALQWPRLPALALAFLAACSPGTPDVASRSVGFGSELPAMRSFAGGSVTVPTRSNVEIAEDFLDLSFRMESGRTVPIMTRFEGPISVRVTGPAGASLVPDLRALIDRMRSEAGIDIFMTGAEDASITIESIPRAQLSQAVPRAACFVVPRISSWAEFLEMRRTPQVDWTTLTRRDRAVVFLPSDVAPQEIRDCLHEELAQAIGPLNDLYRLPDSVFNDDNIHAVLTSFDMLVLRLYYSPELANGMSRGEVAARLPALLSRLNPGGARAGIPINDTSGDWINAIERALLPHEMPARRREAAELAVNLARAFRWDGTRRGFSLYAYGRLMIGADPALAHASFLEAQRIYAESTHTRLHSAYVDLQLSAFALNQGDATTVLALTERAVPVAREYQNASLLASLLMFRSEALALNGNAAEAEAVRLDSLAWARYGFGSDMNVRARLNEISALSPANRG